MQRRRALEGIVVIDLTTSAAGPGVGRCLADHGAEVILIESRSHPSLLRVSAPFKDGIPGLNRGGMYAGLNGSKHSFGLNLTTLKGREIVKKLVARADMMVESFTPGVAERWGLGYADLRKINPDLIMLRSTVYGQTGPYAKTPAWGYVTKGAAGFVHLTGWPDREGMGLPFVYPDLTQPLFSIVAALAALDYRRRTGRGLCIDVSQVEACCHFLSPALLDYTVNKRIQTRMGNRSDNAAPHGVYRCRGRDRWCAIEVFNDNEWRAFCQVIGNPTWTSERRFTNLSGRKENEDELNCLVEEWTVCQSAEDIMVKLQAAGVGAGVAQTCEDVTDHDPQLRHRRHFEVLNHLEMGLVAHPAWPARLSKTPWEPRTAPCLGEHTEHICREFLHMTDQEFVELLADGVLE